MRPVDELGTWCFMIDHVHQVLRHVLVAMLEDRCLAHDFDRLNDLVPLRWREHRGRRMTPSFELACQGIEWCTRGRNDRGVPARPAPFLLRERAKQGIGRCDRRR